jgi:hypothetical protein
MKPKRKIKLVRKQTPSPKPEEKNGNSPCPSLELYNEFIRTCREKPRAEAGIIREWWERIFKGSFPPWDVHPYALCKLKLMYELIRQGYEKSTVPIPPKVQQNIDASRDFNIDGLTESMKQMIGIDIKYQNPTEEAEPTLTTNQQNDGGITMAKATKVKATTKQPRETVSNTIMRVLSENETKKLPDAKLAELINKAHPDKKKNEEKDIKTYRSKYNSGRNWGMTAKPKKLSQCWDKPVAKDKPKAKPTAVVAKKKIVLKRK